MRIWNRLPLAGKLVLVSSALVVAATATGVATSLQVSERLTSAAVDRAVEDAAAGFTQAVTEQTKRAESLAVLVAQDPEVRAAFAAGDRDRLLALTEDSFAVLKADYGLQQLQFHTPPATSFLRVHKPEKFGDDLSSFRHTVVAANADQTMVSGIESGVAGLGLRAVVPVQGPDGAHIGTVEFGLSVDQSFLDRFHESFGVDAALLLPAEDGTFTLAATHVRHGPDPDRRRGRRRDGRRHPAPAGRPGRGAHRGDRRGAHGLLGRAGGRAGAGHRRQLAHRGGRHGTHPGAAGRPRRARGRARAVAPGRARHRPVDHRAGGPAGRAAGARRRRRPDRARRAQGSREVVEMADSLNATLDSLGGTVRSIRDASRSLARVLRGHGRTSSATCRAAPRRPPAAPRRPPAPPARSPRTSPWWPRPPPRWAPRSPRSPRRRRPPPRSPGGPARPRTGPASPSGSSAPRPRRSARRCAP